MRKITKTQAEGWLIKYIAPALSALFLFAGWVAQEFVQSKPSPILMTGLIIATTSLSLISTWLGALYLLQKSRHTEIPFDPDTHWGAYLDERYRRSDFDSKGNLLADQQASLVCAKCVSPPDEVIVHLGNWDGGYKCMRCGTEYTKTERDPTIRCT